MQTCLIVLPPRFSSCAVSRMRIRAHHCELGPGTLWGYQLCWRHFRIVCGRYRAIGKVSPTFLGDKSISNTLFISKVPTSARPPPFGECRNQCTLIVTISGPPPLSRSPLPLTRALTWRAMETRSSSSTMVSTESSMKSFVGESARTELCSVELRTYSDTASRNSMMTSVPNNLPYVHDLLHR